MTPYHDRMPAVLAQDAVDRWLLGEEMAAEEQHVAPDATFRDRKLSKHMNRTGVGYVDPSILEPDELDL
jgi:putative SOS response-associated peptidase YedK